MGAVNTIIAGLALGAGYYYANTVEDVVEVEVDLEFDTIVEETDAVHSTSLIAMGILWGCVEGFIAGGEFVEKELRCKSAQSIASGRVFGMIGGGIVGGVVASTISKFALSSFK